MRSGKGSPYDGATRVPSFWRWPGTLEPADVARLTAHLDVFPALCELAGVKPPEGVKLGGFSLLPLLANPLRPSVLRRRGAQAASVLSVW